MDSQPSPLSAIGGLEVVNRRRVPIIMRVRGKMDLGFCWWVRVDTRRTNEIRGPYLLA